MIPPRATYRLQFRNGMTFARAAALAPYLAELGISHLYASPIFRAAGGSTHGYDVADHGEPDAALGGKQGFAELADALKKHGLGLILDIVPNHMAASPDNPWWADVLRWGRQSLFADHFDIDWSKPRLLLPVLGEPYGEALASGALELRLRADAGAFMLGYHALEVPLAPPSYALILDGIETLADLARLAARTGPQEASDLSRRISEQLSQPKVQAAVENAVVRINAQKAELHRLHEAQIWRLAYWRLAREALTYRRFFEIADLVGVRVENADVFAAVHAFPMQLVREGIVQGFRVDHIDGLADPKAYLNRLREACGVGYVVVEKILGPKEELRAEWACEGTTGYELARWITAVQVDPAGRAPMEQEWRQFCAADPDYRRQVVEAKRRLATVNFAGEMERLTEIARQIAADDLASRDFGRAAIRLVLTELMAALPVYRSYVDAHGADDEDRTLIAGAAARAAEDRQAEDDRVLSFVVSLLLKEDTTDGRRAEFVRRFQQTSGPLTAKAVEDTIFYRYNRLIALNEVGSEPDHFGAEPAAFHAAMARRSETWPAALSATATHDTKRGEDARARLAVLSEMPQDWGEAVKRWSEGLQVLVQHLPGGPAPDREAEWLFFQALAGAWPAGWRPDNEQGLAELADRLAAFMIKAAREAKRRTSWTLPDADYEKALEAYVRGVFERPQRTVLRDIAAMIAAIEPAGFVNSLAQLTLKLTLPGVPDIYQGCELFDFSLVDPDNRRPVDFALRRGLLERLSELPAAAVMAEWKAGWPKLWLLKRLLDLRRRLPRLFEQAAYRGLAVEGAGEQHVLAFERELDGEAIIVVVPRLVLGMTVADGAGLRLNADVFAQTRLNLPASMESAFSWLEGGPVEAGISVGTLFRTLPVAVIVSGKVG
jgi:(1->4)-alpha-D-glucan 1-alpha-D-glucosylmutase